MRPADHHPPKQARSQATLERICAATVELLEAHDWPHLTVARIVRHAGSSVGSFYARFADKDALLDHLDERYTEDILLLWRGIVEQGRRESPNLDALVHLLVRELVHFHRRYRGLIRALVLRARLYRETAYDERTTRMNIAGRDLLTLIVERLPPDEGTPWRAFLAFSFMYSAMRDRILFPESLVAPRVMSDAVLTNELTDAMLAYLNRPLKDSSP